MAGLEALLDHVRNPLLEVNETQVVYLANFTLDIISDSIVPQEFSQVYIHPCLCPVFVLISESIYTVYGFQCHCVVSREASTAVIPLSRCISRYSVQSLLSLVQDQAVGRYMLTPLLLPLPTSHPPPSPDT